MLLEQIPSYNRNATLAKLLEQSGGCCEQYTVRFQHGNIQAVNSNPNIANRELLRALLVDCLSQVGKTRLDDEEQLDIIFTVSNGLIVTDSLSKFICSRGMNPELKKVIPRERRA